jgi:hypothetical protein
MHRRRLRRTCRLHAHPTCLASPVADLHGVCAAFLPACAFDLPPGRAPSTCSLCVHAALPPDCAAADLYASTYRLPQRIGCPSDLLPGKLLSTLRPTTPWTTSSLPLDLRRPLFSLPQQGLRRRVAHRHGQVPPLLFSCFIFYSLIAPLKSVCHWALIQFMNHFRVT